MRKNDYDLLPCPFCGSGENENETGAVIEEGGDIYWTFDGTDEEIQTEGVNLYCVDCGAGFQYLPEEEAKKRWNERYTPNVLKDDLTSIFKSKG